MFRETIRQTPFTGGVAENYFSHIPSQAYNRDVSFVSTLRALVHPRMGEGEYINVSFAQSSYSSDTFRSNRASRVIHAMYDNDYYGHGDFVVHNVACDADSVETNFKILVENFCEIYPSFVRIEKVTDFFRNQFNVLCFVAPETKQVVLFVERLDTRRMHYIQCGIFAYLPWYFDPSKGVTADEMELIKSLREKSPNKYINCLEKAAEKYDFRTMHIKEALKGFETRFERMEVLRVQSDIERKLRDIRTLEDQLANYFRDKRELDIRLLGLETSIANASEDSEIMEYFLCNKKLHLDRVNDNGMVFSVDDYLQYFDEDMAKTMIDNPRSYVYFYDGRACNNYIKAEDMKRLMYAIFIDQTLRIKFCAAYEFYFGEYVHPLTDFAYGSEMRNCMPNPHIDRYRCIGNYERTINQCIKENNYIGALEQAVASCKSLNFGDSTVMKEFMRRMYGLDGYNHNVCVELPDGKVVTPKEAAEWLRKQNEQEEAKAEE